MPAGLKHQLFDDSDSEKRTLKIYKQPQINENNNEKQDLNKYDGEVDRYVPLPPAPPSPPC